MPRTRRPLLVVCALSLAGCVEGLPAPAEDLTTEQFPGETRSVELRYLEFAVENYEQTLDINALRLLPRKTLDELWLLDYDMTESVEIVLQQLSELPPSEADELSVAAQNMRKLLLMTPDNANLEGTKLEKMIGLAEEAFRMKVRASLNALPFKGVDLTFGAVASVNSTPSQIQHVFDFDDEQSMTVEGLKDVLELAEMTVRIQENPAFVAGGDSKDPTRQGNSAVWDLPEWEFEYLIMEMARERTLGADDIMTAPIGAHCNEYDLGTGVTAFSACLDGDGWLVMETFTDIGEPPAPAYFWDMLAEVAQVRLHDPPSIGDPPIAEGDANVEFTLEDIQIPVDQDAIFAAIRANFKANPEALADLAKLLNNNAEGDADFYYVRHAALDADYLYFITDEDIRSDAEGNPVRDYAYAHPGFYADINLGKKLSSKLGADGEPIAGDDTHEKVQLTPGQILFVEDDRGHVYQLGVGEKADRSTIHLDITRVR